MSKFVEFSLYLESFLDFMEPRLTLTFWRIENRRRKAVAANGNSLVIYTAGVVLRPEITSGFIDLRTDDIDPDVALERMYIVVKDLIENKTEYPSGCVNYLEYPRGKFV